MVKATNVFPRTKQEKIGQEKAEEGREKVKVKVIT